MSADLEMLIWSEPSLGSDIKDPLGLGLRVSGRMAGQLLHCITTITPRARYYSFLPWCISEYRKRKERSIVDRGLLDALRQREKALALGCIAHHAGAPCVGGGLVGSDAATKQFESVGLEDTFDLREFISTQGLAWNGYFNSLVNLGCFEEMGGDSVAIGDSDEIEPEESPSLSVDDIRLSTYGQKLADAYGVSLKNPECLADLDADSCATSLQELLPLGLNGGLCEIHDPGARDQTLLRDLFFDHAGSIGKAHRLRRGSLLLIMDLIRQSAQHGIRFDEVRFGDAVVYRGTPGEGAVLSYAWDQVLDDIAGFWQMFYLHNYMSVALEGMFVGLMKAIGESERNALPLDRVVESLGSTSVRRAIAEECQVDLPCAFLETTPSDFLEATVSRGSNGRPAVRSDLTLQSPTAERYLVEILRSKNWKSLSTPAGLAISLELFATTLLRYEGHHGGTWSSWCANNIYDESLDLAPPLVSGYLAGMHQSWWEQPWSELVGTILDQLVIRQHELMGYARGTGSANMILHFNDGVLSATGEFPMVTIGNSRLRFAIQIIKDLGFVDLDGEGLTHEGETWLERELAEF